MPGVRSALKATHVSFTPSWARHGLVGSCAAQSQVRTRIRLEVVGEVCWILRLEPFALPVSLVHIGCRGRRCFSR